MYIIITCVIYTVISSFITSLTPQLYLQALLPYFLCESTGLDQGRDCSGLLSQLRQMHVFNLSVVYVILSGFLPAVVVMLIFDFKLCHKYFSSVCQILCNKFVV